jgi:hypothetical protein
MLAIAPFLLPCLSFNVLIYKIKLLQGEATFASGGFGYNS